MSFITDKQTLDDLNLMGKFRPGSIFSMFNKMKTAGGERVLEEMFLAPLSDATAINARSALFQYFGKGQYDFPFSKSELENMEQYLSADTDNSLPGKYISAGYKMLTGLLIRDEQYRRLQEGVTATLQILKKYRRLLQQFKDMPADDFFDRLTNSQQVLSGSLMAGLLQEEHGDQLLPLSRIGWYDHQLRTVLRGPVRLIQEEIHLLDVYMTVAGIAVQRQWGYAVALPPGEEVFEATALRHPALDKGIANPLYLDGKNNLLFLTGANMAGKSTFMKAFGIAVYLAHMGFPVAAAHIRFSVKAGLYTSINVADNLQAGYSHFYAEVMRVKKVAEEVSSGKQLIVIFDELFKGTNVKDAYDATLAVTASLARYHSCCFVISTHIIEVGHALKEQANNIRFAFLPTIINEQHMPVYTYTLQEGITSDRQGMLIIRQEKILDILEQAAAQ